MQPRQRPIVLSRFFSEANDATIITGDSRRILAPLAAGSAQLVLTSPPYNIGKEYEDRASLDTYRTFLADVLAKCAKLLRPGGSLCVQVGTSFDDRGRLVLLDNVVHDLVQDLIPEHDLHLRNRIVWHYEHGLHAIHRFSGRYETIMWYTKGPRYTFHLDAVRVPQKYPGKRAYKGRRAGKYSGHPLGKNPSDFWTSNTDVWQIPNVKARHVEKTLHPCQFPLDLAARLILALSDRDDLIVDPFGGVGTTAAAAVMLSRRALSIDIHADYSSIARSRVKEAWKGSLPLRPSFDVMTPNAKHAVAALPESFAEARKVASDF